jgi:hypothetical protein
MLLSWLKAAYGMQKRDATGKMKIFIIEKSPMFEIVLAG